MKKTITLLMAMIIPLGILVAQDEEYLYSLTLEELMNIRIVSVSKKSERFFDAPLSSYVISKQDMINAGVNSIPEALKLCPGIIVRELVNGAYDFHIRGFDNPTEYSLTTSSYNLLTLVMIDNRPVFNHNNGGTFFETLPIDLNDIERIEVVRGPASALYGPNAVTGVINIITSRPEKSGVNVAGNVQYGSHNSKIANASVGFKANKLEFTMSGNVQQRDRTTTQYYQFFNDKMVDHPSQFMEMLPYGSSFYIPISPDSNFIMPFEMMAVKIVGADIKFPYPNLAVDKYGFNLYGNYEISSDIILNLSAGHNNSVSQRPYYTHYNTLKSINSSISTYVNFGAKIHEGNFRAAYVNGLERITYVIPGMKYDFNLLDLNFDYDIAIGHKLSFRPSVSMQEAIYDDTRHTIHLDEPIPGLLNAKRKFQNLAGSGRLDYKPIESLRLIAGFRTDKFNYPDDLYHSYQFSASYLFNPNLLLRATYSKANSGAYIGNTYVDFSGEFSLLDMGLPVIWRGEYKGNRNMKIFTSRMFEMGARFNLANFLQMDIDAFTQDGTNMMNFVVQPQQLDIDPQTGLLKVLVSRKMENTDMSIRMYGVTFSASMVMSKMMIKPFITYQYSWLSNFNRYQIHPEVNPIYNVNLRTDKKHDTTPDYYGGIYFNYSPFKKLNINLSPYFYGKQQHYHEQDNVYGRNSDIGQIPAKFQLNGRVGYRIVKGMDLFVSGKNMLNQNVREFYGVDTIGSMYFAGLNFKF